MIRYALTAFLVAAAPVPPAPLPGGAVLVLGTFDPGRQPDGNSVLLTGPDGVIVIDTGRHVEHVAAIERAIAATGKPLVEIVNTHWHLDHVSGNPGLKAAWPLVRVTASDAIDGALDGFLKGSANAARAALAAGKIPEPMASDMRGDLATVANGTALRPDDVVIQSGTVSTLGRGIDLNLARHAATAGDVWVYDPDNRLAVVGDLVTLPAPFLDTACPEGWSRALADVAATDFDTLVPGHGPVLDRAEFATYRKAFVRFVDCARGAATLETCAAGWTTDLGGLLAPTEQPRAERMASYYAGLIRDHKLDANCA